MRITITSSDAAMTFMRRAGYGYQKEGGGEVAFVRRVGGGEFPRYHAYTREVKSDAKRRPEESATRDLAPTAIEINLHVDQKAPTYGRNSVHSGEYEGALVEQEAARLRAIAQPRDGEQENGRTENPPEQQNGFFRRLFG